MRAAYVMTHVRERARGFDAGTAGDPRNAEWAPGPFDVRHELQLQAGTTFGRIGESTRVTISALLSLESGRPFTPMVGGDVNGDGFSNDRAFVLDPTHSTDDVFRKGFRELLAVAPSRVRACLASQIGRIAARSSCRGPWTAVGNLRLDVRPDNGFLARTALSLTISDIPAGIDRLVHGGHPVGWGVGTEMDNVLYTVQGFNPGTRRFDYAVNPAFGHARRVSVRAETGFRVALAVHVDLGASVPDQTLSRWGPERQDRRLSVDSIRTAYMRRVPDPYDVLLLYRDSLRIGSVQIERLHDARQVFLQTISNLADALAADFAASSRNAPHDSLLARQTEYTDSAYAVLWYQGTVVREILSPFQYRLAPQSIHLLFDRPRPPREGELVFF